MELLKVKMMLFSIIVGAGLLSGCGQSQPQQTSRPVQSLPIAVQKKLSSLAQREHTTKQLPSKVSGTPKNVLYIAPTEQFAISQFINVWPTLKTKPDVIWVGTTKSSAMSMWGKEGYKDDPLPSPNTSYIQKFIPTPEAYHAKGNGEWIAAPGILPQQQVSTWTGFFGE